jgi:hypothetical protein
MKLAKKTRRRIYEAQGKPVEITWPTSAPEAMKGHRYPVYTKEGRAFQIRVEAIKRGATTKCVVKIDADPFRPMFGLAGQRNDAGDYESEPERVSAEYEARRALEGRTKTGILGLEHRITEAKDRKELRIGEQGNSRAARAVARHQRSIERRLADSA